VAFFFLFVCALEQLGHMQTAEHMMLSLTHTLSMQNKRRSPNPLPDPYHDTEQALLHQIGTDSDLDGEEFDGRWAHREIIPYLPLLVPHRLTAMLSNAVDSISANPR